ncbi:hypothetical protein KQ51_01397 [Candidatus Izimaplasma bacterium HR1]|jgi:hypothetical protein|uniref:hypothetical protein n=1 Tax=Candidatus Izimoplasma sp. HR1 TaxID=1541959 RepID=UPI0004F6028D|nr:hypothetical protein KQ51_01397 [Candidatus Izimaplasma bacterium HR1]
MSIIQKVILSDLIKNINYLEGLYRFVERKTNISDDRKQKRLDEVVGIKHELNSFISTISSKSMTIDEMKKLDFKNQRIFRLWN